MMLVTKAGLKLWASGLIGMAVVFASSFLWPYLSFGEVTFLIFVLLPLVIGWCQRWFWFRSFTKITEGIRDAEKF